jgi:hypothetical protein
MNFRILSIPLIATSIIVVSTFFTYQVFSYSHKPVNDKAGSPIYTLKFPDQEYAISASDLNDLEGELIIPTGDNPNPKISYNTLKGELESIISPQDYVLSVDTLRHQIENYLGDLSTTITPTYTLRDRYTTSLAEFNAHLNQTYRSPLNISLKDGSQLTDVTLAPAFLRSIIRPISTDLLYPIDINKEALLTYLNTNLTPKQKKYFNPDSTYQNTKNALNLRFMGNETPVVLGVDDGPTSHGEKADKYLEVDLSQQKMYFFIGGTLYKEYKVSTGIDYPTPVGEFHILNKEPKAFSTIYNVWMPYWMAFKYASDVGAYLGLHEIAYALDKKGKPVYNHGYYIGDMMTGGCVAMEPKDSREIYNLSDVGMLVRIVK